MTKETKQFDFLAVYIEKVLYENGLDRLSEEQKKIYVPQLTSHLEERIGLEMLPKLSEENLLKFANLAEAEDTSEEDWKNFWYSSISNFEEELKMVLEKFSKSASTILSKTI